MQRKIELQSPADFTYLYGNTVALSRQKLDLHLPPSATVIGNGNNNSGGDGAPDPMRERVRELVDEVSPHFCIYVYKYYVKRIMVNEEQYITKTFTSASPSLNINGLDDNDTASNHQFAIPGATTTTSTGKGVISLEALQAPAETIEYEAYDTALAARVTSLYAQLESLTTTVAQLRRDAPRKAAGLYARELGRVINDDDAGDDYGGEFGDGEETGKTEGNDGEGDVSMADTVQQQDPSTAKLRRQTIKPKWKIKVPLGSEAEAQRWRNGDMAEVYDDALRTLLRLQGEADDEDDSGAVEGGSDGNALATTVGKAERAGRAAEVVEKM